MKGGLRAAFSFSIRAPSFPRLPELGGENGPRTRRRFYFIITGLISAV